MSVWQGQGLEALAPYLSPGTTCVLLGSSGVGKSTIVNHLLASHAKLQRELAFLERKQDKRAQAEHKKNHRAMNLAKRTRQVR